jgi:putative pyruvate formate lyase activating enzyme
MVETAAVPEMMIQGKTRAVTAGMRAPLARRAYSDCHLCAHHCGVDRSAGAHGFCQAGIETNVFSAQTEVSDELELIPTFAIALGGCDLRCSFCITGKESWDATSGTRVMPASIAVRAVEAVARGARSIMILGGEPTIHLPAVLDIVAELPVDVPLIWKTNAHGSAQARELLDGLFDLWLVDYKFGNDACAKRLSLVSDYTEVVRENLLWAYSHSELMIRHLVMPNHVECCWEPVARWISHHIPAVKISLRTGFWPAWRSRKHFELGGTTTQAEAKAAKEIAELYNLKLVA